ncbi:hypothetical protein L6164_002315 [Bauhinia variegata]|uniref:Uncharacterized protein n=1 Tax=Bauhinia variegata TaxID=167791 RepID=A0ACB9PZZ4_BAUVA|nr:hypothetical protein L6164_002315 [Bauhinia variegata]
MAEPNPSATPSSSAVNGYASAAASSSLTSSEVHQEENVTEHAQHQSSGRESQLAPVHFPGINWGLDDAAAIVRDDTWSCVIVLLTFWIFVSMTMILGVYGSVSLLLGPNSSILLQPNSFFVQYLKVENLDDSQSGVMLYGTYGTPPLDVVTTWEETYNVSVPYDSHKEWEYYLNTGSQINISYRLSSSIFLVIAQGSEDLTQWLEDPTYPNSTFSWNIIHGTGMITQNIYSSSTYYVAVGNLNEDAEVELTIRIKAFLYNTSNAYYKCALTGDSCGLSIFFPSGNAAVLTTPGPEQNTSRVKLSYGPRWIIYIFGIVGMTMIMSCAFNCLNKLQFGRDNRPPVMYDEAGSQRAPLLSYKDDDLSSWGSSFDSLSHDEEDFDLQTRGSMEGKSLGDGETHNNTRRLCGICFDAPRDCFFLPCGHCVACFECATRIAEAAGTCPVCCKNMKKVRKIFTV